MIEIRWLGRGGQGSFTAAKLLGMAASIYEDKYVLAFPSFGPERRGAPVSGFTRISSSKITDRSEPDSCDYLVILDETLWNDELRNFVKTDSTIIINSSESDKYITSDCGKTVTIDATKLALEYLGIPITNTALLGALIAISQVVKTESCIKSIENSMSGKIAEKNINLFTAAFEFVSRRYGNE